MTSYTTRFATDLGLGVTPDQVTIRPKASLNNYGEPGYAGNGTVYDCYVRKMRIGSRTGDQEQDIVQYQVYIFSPTLTVDVEDELTMPGNLKRPIISVDYRRDEYQQQAVVLSVGR